MQSRLNELLLKTRQDSRLTWSEQIALAEDTGLSWREVEEIALELGIMPLRYQRNLDAISIKEQLLLFRSRVAVIGCGGLGGYVIEELARLGVGTICAWDYDQFEEHNLNRQFLAQINSIGQSKVETAAARIKAINPVVQFAGFPRQFAGLEDREFLVGTQVVIDALDNIPSRLDLARVCRELKIPLVHGAVSGWYGQLSTQFPGETTLEQIYGHFDSSQGPVANPPVLSFLPATIASVQVAEATKIIIGRGDLLRGKLMIIDLLNMDIDILDINT
ncbi:MAG: HesA/MoeB/ThiF family protein [Firmicutes bacterium]|nr:HesA/MoeB/ThiF family protein [Bacillota bacterium]